MDGRNQVFQRLKPLCIGLSQAALTLSGPNIDVHLVVERLESLYSGLQSIVRAHLTLDSKLADYVFFPLSQVLKASQKISIRCLELAFQCLAILIHRGWRAHIQEQLAAQVIILCTLMAEKRPRGLSSSSSTDELQASALWCLHYVFNALGDEAAPRAAMLSQANFPQLGQTVTTILDAAHECISVDGQIAAISALRSLTQISASRPAQAAFLPGIVSKLTKTLIPQTTQRRNHAVIVGALEILATTFSNTLSERSQYISDLTDVDIAPVIDDKWQQEASRQLKPAITAVLRLKDHDRLDVKEAVAQLCFVILKDCQQSLRNCSTIALETLLFLASEETGDAVKLRVEAFSASDPAMSTLIRNILYEWLQSLTGAMQSANDLAKVQRLQQVRTVYDIVATSDGNTNAIGSLLTNVLRDSLVVVLGTSKSEQHRHEISAVQALDTSSLSRTSGGANFETPLTSARSGQMVIDALSQVLRSMQSSPISSIVFTDLVRSLHQTQNDVQLATFWLLLSSAEMAVRSQDELNAFLAVDTSNAIAFDGLIEELYAFSIMILNSDSETFGDNRFRALALRTLALRAQQSGADFRLELIDVLYPVLHTLATPDRNLQHDSIATLNIFTEACGYASVQDLIVENVDYLTNAVALKLNAFDVSPQAPQVLLMMVQLAGPNLIPYLEDTVDSIFAALEDYHGYPLLVELLFRCLGVVAVEGAKAPQLAITDQAAPRQMYHAVNLDPLVTSVAHLSDLLKERRDEEHQLASQSQSEREPHPERPWNQPEKHTDEEMASPEEVKSDDEDMPGAENEPLLPAPKTYSLLLKISELTQHFLPASSVSLRSSLLHLIQTTIPAIARHENSFLPLVNTLWPEIVPRLDDNEPQVVGNALAVIGLLCEHAKDFMRGRILQLWPRLVQIWQEVSHDLVQAMLTEASQERSKRRRDWHDQRVQLQQALTRMRSSPADYVDTSARMLWKTLVLTITSIVQYVGVPPEVFDEALEMMEPALDDEWVSSVFERENGDAVWLLRARRTAFGSPSWSTPCLRGEAYFFAPLAV